MDFFSIGNISGYIKSIDMQKAWERKKESGLFKEQDKDCPERSRDRISIREPISASKPVSPSVSGELSLYEKLKEQLESFSAVCAESADNGSKTASGNAQNEKSFAELFMEQIKAYENAANSAANSEDKVNGAEKPEKSISDWVKEQMDILQNSLAEKDKSKDSQLHSINSKLNSGQKLTPSEKQYLMTHDPMAYQNAQRIENDSKYYSKMLSCCRTKDDVHSLRLSYSLSALAELKKLKGGEGDISAISAIWQRNAALERETNNFVRRGGYSALPTRAECRKVASDLRKARLYELEKKRAKAAARRKTAEAKKKRRKAAKTPGDGKRTVAQVLQSTTAKKVRRSMAKRAYLSCAAAAYHVVTKNRMDARG